MGLLPSPEEVGCRLRGGVWDRGRGILGRRGDWGGV